MRPAVAAKMVEVVRADHVVGRGSCSVIDETFTDEELLAALDEDGVTNCMSALRWARRFHRVWASNARETAGTAW